MRLLLDTHVLIWVFEGSPLEEDVLETIQNPDNIIFVSAVTAWEIAIKRKLGKLQVPYDYQEQLKLHRFVPLAITDDHALATENLPLHHNDPFDRLLIAQAQVEDLTLVSRDSIFEAYEVSLIKA